MTSGSTPRVWVSHIFEHCHENLSQCHSGSDPPENPIRARSDMLVVLILVYMHPFLGYVV